MSTQYTWSHAYVATIQWIMIVNATGMKWLKQLFHITEHRINNTGWMMKWWWAEGWNEKQNCCWENAERFWLTFSYTSSGAMSRIYACKTERNLQIFGWCLQFKQLCPWATLSYFCLQKQGREINAMRQVVSENVSKRAQRYHLLGMRRSLFANWIHYIATKNHNLFVKTGTKRELEKKGIAATG